MEIPRQCSSLIAFVVIVVGLAIAEVGHAADPAPSPTPKPGTLAAFARSTQLDRSAADPGSGRIVITTDNLARLGEGAALSETGPPAAEPPAITTDVRPDPTVRSFWRKKVLAQSRNIARLESHRDRVLEEIDRLERGRLDGRALDRIEKAESKLRQVEGDIKREKARLSNLVREARKQGAQPGWFR